MRGDEEDAPPALWEVGTTYEGGSSAMTNSIPRSQSSSSAAWSPGGDRKLFPHFKAHPVPYLNVKMEDPFWAPRQETARETTLAWTTRAHDRSGGLDALRGDPDGYIAQTTLGEMEHVKLLEAMATAIGVEDDPDIARLVDAWSAPLIEGQAADGYLAEKYPLGSSRSYERFEVRHGWRSHEDYLIGHYIEAAIAFR